MGGNRHYDEVARLEQRLSEEKTASENLRRETAGQAEQLAAARAELAAVRDSREYWKRAYYRLANRFPISLARKVKHVVERRRSNRSSAALTPTSRGRSSAATVADAARLHEALLEQTGHGLTTGPKVSLIILNRDGESHLRRLVPALVGTRYEPFELIVVDNASSDGSIAYLEAAAQRLSLMILRNDENRSFAEANQQGASRAEGELLLLLNNDIEPVSPDWLGRLVETLLETDAAAVGPRLVYPRRSAELNAGDDILHPDLTLQHRGIDFDSDPDGIPRGRNLGSGEDALSELAADTREVPALSAACLLVRRESYEAVGGLGAGYRYGTEDVDLCLKLRARGAKLVYDGSTILYHHEFGTQGSVSAEIKTENRTTNRKLFVDRWGPQVFRRVLEDRLRGDGRWSEAPLRIGITLTKDDATAGYGDYYTAHELGDALSDLGFDVSYWERYRDRWLAIDPSIDVVIALLDAFPVHRAPENAVLVAWVRNWTDRWIERPGFDDYDIVLASSSRSKEIIEERSSQVASVLPLATNPIRFAPGAGDSTLCCDLAFTGNHWDAPRDVAKALPGLASEYEVKVFGSGWEDVAGMAPLVAGILPYEDLPCAYASAALVVDDSATHAKPFHAVNSRVFDALASGTLVVTNCEGAAELFDAEFPTWKDEASLRRVVSELQADPTRTQELAERYRAKVLDEHTYVRRAEQLRDLLLAWCDSSRFSLAVGVPRRDEAHFWGDYHFARSLQRELRGAGHPTSIELLPAWDRAVGARSDVRLHLFGLSEMRPRRGQVNLLWVISHPELVEPAMIDAYDAAFVASRPFAERLARRCRKPVTALMQAADPRRFYPDPTGPEHSLLFVGNSRGVRRRIVDAVIALGHRIAVYGREWTPDLIDPSLVHGESIDNRELRRFYSSAQIVLNDHWDDMRAHGFPSNRLYDAMACGACVVSDHLDEIKSEFDRAVVTYEDSDQLARQLERLLADADLRKRLGARGRELVLARHTFAHRVKELLAVIGPLLADRAHALDAAPAADERRPTPIRDGESASRLRADGQIAADPRSDRAQAPG